MRAKFFKAYIEWAKESNELRNVIYPVSAGRWGKKYEKRKVNELPKIFMSE